MFWELNSSYEHLKVENEEFILNFISSSQNKSNIPVPEQDFKMKTIILGWNEKEKLEFYNEMMFWLKSTGLEPTFCSKILFLLSQEIRRV